MTDPDALAAEASLRRVRTRSGVVSYRAAGEADAPALVLLHGVGSGSASWSAQLAALAEEGLRVVAWDAPGYGASDRLPAEVPSAADYAAALADFTDALALGRFRLLGHSLGALIAAAFARVHGSARVDRLVLASPASGYRSAAEDARHTRVDGRLADMAQLGPAGLAEKRAAGLLSPQAPRAAIEKVRAVMSTLRPDGYAQAVRMLGQADLFADAKTIAVPTLVLCGTADRVTPEDGCRRVAAAIAGARFHALAGLGHACYIEDPAAFNRALLDFLALKDVA